MARRGTRRVTLNISEELRTWLLQISGRRLLDLQDMGRDDPRRKRHPRESELHEFRDELNRS